MNGTAKIVLIVLFFALMMVCLSFCECVCVKGRPRDPTMEDMLREHMRDVRAYQSQHPEIETRRHKARMSKNRQNKTIRAPFPILSAGPRKLFKGRPRQPDLETGEERDFHGMRVSAGIDFIMLGSRHGTTLRPVELAVPQGSRPPAYRGRDEDTASISSRPPSYHAGARPVAPGLRTPPPAYIA